MFRIRFYPDFGYRHKLMGSWGADETRALRSAPALPVALIPRKGKREGMLKTFQDKVFVSLMTTELLLSLFKCATLSTSFKEDYFHFKTFICLRWLKIFINWHQLHQYFHFSIKIIYIILWLQNYKHMACGHGDTTVLYNIYIQWSTTNLRHIT